MNAFGEIGEDAGATAAPQNALHALLSPDNPQDPPRLRVFTLSGRLNRVRYLVYALTAGLSCAVALAALYYATAFLPRNLYALTTRVAYICVVNVILPVMFCILSIRRLHDINARGWWAVLLVIPFVSAILTPFVSAILACIPGSKGANRYGVRPPPNGPLLNATAVVLPLLLLMLFVHAYQRRDSMLARHNLEMPQQPGRSAPLRPYQP